jgi:hypothetical protein
MRFAMKLPTIRTFTIAFLVFTSSALWCQSNAFEEPPASAGTMSTIELQTRIGTKGLPNDEIEDMSLLYPSAPKR